MKLHSYWVLCVSVLLVIVFPGASSAQSVDIQKGQTVVVKIPFSYWEKNSVGAAGGPPIYSIPINHTFLSDEVWSKSEFPQVAEFKMEKTKSKGSYFEVEVRNLEVFLKLRFAKDITDINSVLDKVLWVGSTSDFLDSGYFAKVLASMEGVVFGDSASVLSPEQKYLLLSAANFENGGLSTEKYKGRTYMVRSLGVFSDEHAGTIEPLNDNETVFNSIQINQYGRIARVMNQTCFLVTKKFGLALGKMDDFGLKIEVNILYRNFGDDTRFEEAPTYEDVLEIYMSSANISLFIDDEITTQELIDQSVVKVNGNRISVYLAQSQ